MNTGTIATIAERGCRRSGAGMSARNAVSFIRAANRERQEDNNKQQNKENR